MPIKLITTGGGSVTLDANSTASNYTLTAPARSGNIITSADSNTVTQGMLASNVAGNGPAFQAYLSTNQNVTSLTTTVIALDIEVYDTGGFFNNTGSTVGGIPAYSFKPTVAGWYMFNLMSTGGASSALGYVANVIQLNGSIYIGYQTGSPTFNSVGLTQTCSALQYMNGTSDYITFYERVQGTSPYIYGGVSLTTASGTLVRAA